MFKGKKAIVILVPLNIAIWSFFIYRFYNAFHESDELDTIVNTSLVKTVIEHDSMDYVLSLNYTDPFLKSQKKRSNLRVGKVATEPMISSSNTVLKSKMPEKAPMPEIKYLGLVKNSSTGISTAIVSINGQSRIVKQNETVDGIVIKSFDGNEMLAMYGKEKISIRK